MDKLKSIAVPTKRPVAAKPRRAGRPQVAADDTNVGGKVGAGRTVATAPRPAQRHRYHVGQRLRLLGGGSTRARADGGCKVVSLMPHEGGAFYYRVRSETENFERVVAEADLVTPDLP